MSAEWQNFDREMTVVVEEVEAERLEVVAVVKLEYGNGIKINFYDIS